MVRNFTLFGNKQGSKGRQGNPRGTSRRRGQKRRRLSIERLEERQLLSVLFQDNFDSGMSPSWVSRVPRQWVEGGWLHTKEDGSGPIDSMAVVNAG